jgi:CDP-glycerol glycerophosphotransferase
MKRFLVYPIRVILYYLFRIFPIKKNKLFIVNFNGKGYGDNPKYIVEDILKRKLPFKIIWAVQKKHFNDFPKGSITLVLYGSIRSIFEEVTSKIWIDNCRKQPFVRKRKMQFYIQTWHGEAGILKKIEKDAENNLSPYYIKQAKHDSKLIDLILSCSVLRSKLYKSSFWYNGNILECGSPRDDILLSPNKVIKNKIYKYFNIENNTNILLYAPTFRDNFNLDIFNLDYESILKTLKEQTKENWIFLVRLHPNISGKASFLKYNKTIINATEYNDMQELMAASAILITDYSGCMFEFSMMKKPVFLYAKDYTEYKNERDFYVDITALPFPFAMDMDNLLKKITCFDKTTYIQKVQAFFQDVGLFDNGRASEKTVNRIIEEINRNDT